MREKKLLFSFFQEKVGIFVYSKRNSVEKRKKSFATHHANSRDGLDKFVCIQVQYLLLGPLQTLA